MSKITIIRGLPGSGKSLLAAKLSGERGIIRIEPDMLCVADGKYAYSAEAYQHYEAVAESLLYDICHHTGADVIYCDVLPNLGDVLSVLANVPKDYAVEVIDLKITPEESLKRNRHTVRPEDIERMAAEWQDWRKNE